MKYIALRHLALSFALGFSFPTQAATILPTGGTVDLAASTIIGDSDSQTVSVAASYDPFHAETRKVSGCIGCENSIFAQATLSGTFSATGISLSAIASVHADAAPVVTTSATANAILGFDLDASQHYAYSFAADSGIAGITSLSVKNGAGVSFLDLYFGDSAYTEGTFLLPAGHYILTATARSGGPRMSQIWGANLSVNITATPSPVPLPSAVWTFGSALLGLGGYARRRSVSATPASIFRMM